MQPEVMEMQFSSTNLSPSLLTHSMEPVENEKTMTDRVS
jgi:hypothetical protein